MELNFIYAYSLVIIALLYSYYKNFGLEKELFKASIWAFFQLALLGFLFVYIFEVKSLWVNLAIFVFMSLFAARVASKRVVLRSRSYAVALFSISLSSAIVLLTLLFSGAISWAPQESIPMTGLVVGNALNAYTLCMDRFKESVLANLGAVEGRLALGVRLEKAVEDEGVASIKASMIPNINTLRTIGFVFIPGIMTGMLIAGASPLVAFAYQLTILYTITGISLFSAMFAVRFGYRYLFFDRREGV